MKGSYLLQIRCLKTTTIQIGKLGRIKFEKGDYIYVGSAMNSLEKRIKRHYSKDKKLHWHIDYLTLNKNFKIISTYIKPSNQKQECLAAQSLNFLPAIANFGSTDCSCQSHLFKIPQNFTLQKTPFVKTYKLFNPFS